ncbi:MAG: UbiD family decarboxylase [Nitrospinota bacterium]|nr:UbiD family decarboxylase [Nitrospinota bacterium]
MNGKNGGRAATNGRIPYRDMRGLLDHLEANGELLRIKKPVPPKYMHTLLAKSDQAVLFENVADYDMSVVGGLIGSRRRLALGLASDEKVLGRVFMDALERPIPAEVVPDGPVQEVVKVGDEVDLTEIPIPFQHRKDGGPYISAGIAVCKDEEGRRNVGCYRLMYRTPNETGIDLVSPSDMRFTYQRALDRGEPLPIAIALGTGIPEILSAAYKAPPGFDEFAVAGGLYGEPVRLTKCATLDLEVPASAEIVLEGEISADGWTIDEGRYGDFTGHQCSIRWNPVFKVKAITHRKDPIFQTIFMPWENDWLEAPPMEAAGWRALREASVQTTAVYSTPASCCYWHLFASIKKRPGEGKNALLALMALHAVKLVIVTDDDVDITDWMGLERALAFRVQPDEDVIIVSGARGKHLDPTLRASQLPKGSLPTTSKMGIDATIPEGVDRSEYELLEYPFLDEVKLEDYL